MIHLARRDAPPSPRRVRPGTLVAGVIVLLALVLSSPHEAGAHEIGVTLAIPRTSQDSRADAAAVVDGLRLAIDQSPDVGHAPGSDAGDHLGGVDVVLIVLENMSGEEVGVSVREATVDGASVVVVVGDAATVAAVAEEIPPESGFLIAVLRGPGDVDTSLPGAVLRQTSADDPEAAGAFREDFVAAYGRDPSDSAAIGYDVGQLLDVLIEETGDGVPDRASLDEVAAAAQARLRVTSLEGVAQMPPPIAQGSVDKAEEGGDVTVPIVLVGVLVTLAALVALRILRRRSASRIG